MATIKEDYVSFETAKLLIKKGFDFNAEYESYYTLGGVVIYFKDKTQDINIAPRITLQMAMKWLRNTFLLEIYPFHDAIQENNDWWYRIELHTKGCSVTKHESDVIYKTYEQACEAAIKYCLENLIK